MRIQPDTTQQIQDAYREMANVASYRPAAYEPAERQCTSEELARYVQSWWAQEEKQTYEIGCPSAEGRKALIWTVEAATLMCAVEYVRALAVLKRAAREVEEVIDERRRQGLRDSVPL